MFMNGYQDRDTREAGVSRRDMLLCAGVAGSAALLTACGAGGTGGSDGGGAEVHPGFAALTGGAPAVAAVADA